MVVSFGVEVYGRTLTRWKDAEKMLGPRDWVLHEIMRQKLKLERRTHRLWPKFVSHEEDCLLQKPKWELKYGKMNDVRIRPIMWDMTMASKLTSSVMHKSSVIPTANTTQVTVSRVVFLLNCVDGVEFMICGEAMSVTQITMKKLAIWMNNGSSRKLTS